MKRSIITLFIFAIGVTMFNDSFGTIRRVGFKQTITPVNGLDYNTFQDAHDAASNGDTIQLYPATPYVGYNGTVTKRLVILGPGYFTNSFSHLPGSGIFNQSLQNLPGRIEGNYFTIGVGSAGTVFQGIPGLSLTTSNSLDSLNDIFISRSSVNVSFNNSGVCNNWIISQCHGVSVTQSGYGISFSANRTITNLRIENSLGVSVNFSATGPQSPIGVNSGQILNCVWGSSATGVHHLGGYLALNNSTFVIQNCIDVYGVLGNGNSMSGVANSVFINNITTHTSTNNPVFTNPGSTGNVFGVNPAGNSIFVGYPNNISGSTTLYSPDGAWQLSATSIAKAAGIIPGTTTPTDCGIFGGLNPYKASGMPAIPSFYKLNSSSSTATTSPYTIQFSIRANN